MPDILKPTFFGNPILRSKAQLLSEQEIKSEHIQQLIANMFITLEKKPYGVGIAAPQVGVGVAVAVVGIKPSKNRPELKPFKLTIINPVIVETYGRREQMWEGCISCGSTGNGLFAKVPRYKKLRLRWHNEKGEAQDGVFDGFQSHVIQHEIDHLHGVLFVDKVIDTTSYMTASEYRKRVVAERLKSSKK